MKKRPPFPETIDSTIRKAFSACPRHAELEYFRHYKTRTRSVHLVAGGAFAAGIEVSRKEWWDKGNRNTEECLAAGVAEMIRHWGDFLAPEKSPKQLDRMIEALDSYFANYGWGTDYITPYKDPESDSHAIEWTFAIPIDVTHPVTGNPLMYTGRFDMLGMYGGSLFVVDEKTTTSLGEQWVKQWRMRAQFTGYCWAAQQYDLPIAGAIVRGISILKTKFGHAESIQQRPQYMIDAWYDQLCRDVRRMISCWEEGFFDQNLDDACGSYGGCLFTDVCSSNKPQRILDQDFSRRRWDPLVHEEFDMPPEEDEETS